MSRRSTTFAGDVAFRHADLALCQFLTHRRNEQTAWPYCITPIIYEKFGLVDVDQKGGGVLC